MVYHSDESGAAGVTWVVLGDYWSKCFTRLPISGDRRLVDGEVSNCQSYEYRFQSGKLVMILVKSLSSAVVRIKRGA